MAAKYVLERNSSERDIKRAAQRIADKLEKLVPVRTSTQSSKAFKLSQTGTSAGKLSCAWTIKRHKRKDTINDHNLDADTHDLLARLSVPGADAPDLMMKGTKPWSHYSHL
jgi:hypothetical protein